MKTIPNTRHFQGATAAATAATAAAIMASLLIKSFLVKRIFTS
jgi:hypothetical protein